MPSIKTRIRKLQEARAIARSERKERDKPVNILARRAEIIAEISKQRDSKIVVKQLATTKTALSKKKDDLDRAKLLRLTPASSDVRLLRKAKVLDLTQEVKALQLKRSQLKTELPKARRADKLREKFALAEPSKPIKQKQLKAKSDTPVKQQTKGQSKKAQAAILALDILAPELSAGVLFPPEVKPKRAKSGLKTRKL